MLARLVPYDLWYAGNGCLAWGQLGYWDVGCSTLVPSMPAFQLAVPVLAHLHGVCRQ